MRPLIKVIKRLPAIPASVREQPEALTLALMRLCIPDVRYDTGAIVFSEGTSTHAPPQRDSLTAPGRRARRRGHGHHRLSRRRRRRRAGEVQDGIMFLISQGEVQLSVRDALSTTGRKIVATVHDGQACHAPLERSLPKIEIHYHTVSTTTVLFGSGRRSPLRAISENVISSKQAEQTSYEPDSRASLWPARCLAKARSRSGTPACVPRLPSPRRAPRHPHDGAMSWHDHCVQLLLLCSHFLF